MTPKKKKVGRPRKVIVTPQSQVRDADISQDYSDHHEDPAHAHAVSDTLFLIGGEYKDTKKREAPPFPRGISSELPVYGPDSSEQSELLEDDDVQVKLGGKMKP